MTNSFPIFHTTDQGEKTPSSTSIDRKLGLGKNKDPFLNNERSRTVLQGLISEFNGVEVGNKHLRFQIRTFIEYLPRSGPSVDGFAGPQFWGREVDANNSGENITHVLSIRGVNYAIPHYFRTVDEAIHHLQEHEHRIESGINNRLSNLGAEKAKVQEFSKEKSKNDDNGFTPYQSGHIEQLFSEEGSIGELITQLQHKLVLQKIRERLASLVHISAISK